MTSRFAKRGLYFLFCAAVVLVTPACARALDRKISGSLSHYIMGVMHENLGELDAALREYRQVLKLDPHVPAVHVHIAASFIKKNDIDGAIRELNQIARLEPDAVEPHAILALLYSAQNKTDLATSEYEYALKNAAKLDPQNVDIYKTLGVIYFRQKNFKEAEKTFRLITRISGGDADAHYYLANICYELKDFSSAEAELKASLKLKPESADVLNFLGYLYAEQGRNLDEAEALIRKALQIDPENGAYLDSLGWVYFKKGKPEEALRELETASSLLEDPVISDPLGDVFLNLGDREKARAQWELSLKLDPDQKEVKEKLKAHPIRQ